MASNHLTAVINICFATGPGQHYRESSTGVAMNAPRYISRRSEESPMHNYALPASMTNGALLLPRWNLNGDIDTRQIRGLHGLSGDDIFNGSESDIGESRAADLLERREEDLTLEELFERAALLGPSSPLRARSWSVPMVQVLLGRNPELESWRWWFR